jgi:hypothetical protein
MQKKVQPIFLQIQRYSSFCQKTFAHRLRKNASSLSHHASNNNKSKIVAHPSDHDNAQFGPTQQPTNNPAALI